LKGNKKSLATVVGIIDGTGTIIGSIAQSIIPFIQKYSFLFYTGLTLAAALALSPLAMQDYKKMRRKDEEEFQFYEKIAAKKKEEQEVIYSSIKSNTIVLYPLFR
jgi:hypothetical protein